MELSEDQLEEIDAAKLTPKQTAFLAAYAVTGTLTQAAKGSGVSVRSHHRWREGCEAYLEAFEAAHQEACDHLEAEARRRAIQGQRRLKFDRNGQPLIDPDTGKPYSEHRYSDALLMFLLKANNPGKFGDKIEQTHRGTGSAVRVYSVDDPPEALFYLPENGREAAGTVDG
ncbi:hypothetical protein [Botrimarina mediterranea]|uniref:hypothetical protein n=1 Tax=Botrimarina mediterranea TaxID=2528022 RepID=UPI00118D1270|nr:hypothetical protein K2D_34790 [Planctomycetes bacterium K2D]